MLIETRRGKRQRRAAAESGQSERSERRPVEATSKVVF
jgi:hypothetical protein